MLVCIFEKEPPKSLLKLIEKKGGVVKKVPESIGRIPEPIGPPKSKTFHAKIEIERGTLVVDIHSTVEKIKLNEEVKNGLTWSMAVLLDKMSKSARGRMRNSLVKWRVIDSQLDRSLVADIVRYRAGELADYRDLSWKSVNSLRMALREFKLDLAEYLDQDVLAYANSVASREKL